MTRTATSSNEARSKIAKRRIESFTKCFGEPHFYLACHAAFPLALTPDLLYHLWANFQQDVNSNLLNIPWIAVADLLLSNLCNEVGYELYEIDWAIRNELLNQLKDNPCFGQQRILELSNFLLAYMREQLNSSNPDIRDFAQAQKWTALAYAQPHEAAREIASNLASLNIENESEWLRLTSLVETLADPLAGYEPLLVYISGMKSFVRGNVTEAKNFLNQVIDSKDEIKVAGVKLLIPEQLKAKLTPKIASKTKRHRWLIGVSLTGAIVGTGIFIWQQLNPQEFQQLWNSLFNQEQKVTKENILLWIQGSILKGHQYAVNSITFSPDGKTLASASQDKTIELWNIETGKEIITLNGHSAGVTSISFSPDGKFLASASRDKKIKLWNIETGELIITVIGHDDAVTSITFSPDGKTLASASQDKTIKLWNIETGELIRTLTGHNAEITSITFSPDGKTLASASQNKTIKLWNIETGKEIRTLNGHSAGVTSITFSPDGKTLASASQDNTIKIWSLDGKELQTLNLQNPVLSIAFSPDAQTLATASGNDIILWRRATVDNLIVALNNPSADVRRTSASALGSLGSQAQSAVPALAALLKDSDANVRASAASALGSLGSQAQSAAPALAALLKDSDANVRYNAISALGNLGQAAAPYVPDILNFLKDEKVDKNVRASAAIALGNLGDAAKPYVKDIVDILKDEKVDSLVRASAAIALGNLGDAAKPYVKDIADILKDEKVDSLVRASVATALGNLGDAAKPYVKDIADILKDEKVDSSIRASVATALGNLGDAAAIPSLTEALKDSNPSVRQNADSALKRINR